VTIKRLTAICAIAASVLLAPAADAADRDHDRMSDRWERRHHVRSARADHDRDRLTNIAEFRAHTNPRRRDSDRDGVRDGVEDADRDRLVNAVETATANHPLRADTDADGRRDGAEGAGQVVAVDGQTITIALGASTAFSPDVASPLASIASTGRRVTGRAELPHALLCGNAEEWLGPVDRTSDGAEDAAQREAEDEEQFEDGEESDEEVARAASVDAPAEPIKLEGNPVLSDDELEAIEDREYAEMGHEDDPDAGVLSDACPAGTLEPGAWVHEVTVASSEEAGVEFEEIVIVR
jgi:hypothetical protein